MLPHSEVGSYSPGTTLGRNEGKWGYIVSLGRPVLSQAHMQPSTHLCQGKVRFVLRFSVTNTWCGKWGDGAVLPNPSFCFSIHLLWLQIESAAKEGWWFITPSGFRSMSGEDVYLEPQSQRLCQASCDWYLPWSSYCGLVEYSCPTFLGLGCFFFHYPSLIHKDFKSLYCRSWRKQYLTSHLRTTFLLFLGM